MIGDKSVEIIAQARNLNYPTRMNISLTKTPHTFMTGPDIDADIILTNGLYHLVYHTKTRLQKVNVRKKFDIVFDFGNKLLKVENYHELEMQARTNRYAKFFFEYTNLCKEMFIIAGLNEGMHIPFVFDVVKYYKDVCAEQGWKIDEGYHMILNPYRESNCTFWGEEDNKLVYYDISRNKEGKHEDS